MVKTVVLYKEPANREAFDKYYFGNHIPLVSTVPGLIRAEVSKFTLGPAGAAPYYLMAELYFNSTEEMAAGWISAEGKAVGKDVRNFVTDQAQVTMAFAEVSA